MFWFRWRQQNGTDLKSLHAKIAELTRENDSEETVTLGPMG
jgi:hypothetical protein